ncbi:MAG: DUF5667 domain-containing protein [Candidatus Paceibacterota bacterium]
MTNKRDTTEYLKQVAEIELPREAKLRMRESLSSYADFHKVTEGVREGEVVRSTEHIQQQPVWSTLLLRIRTKTMYIHASLLIALMVAGGGTAALAAGAVPGDMLYPVKIHVNENVRSAAAIGANAEARLQAGLLAERVEEANELASRGEFEGEAATEAHARILAQAEVAQEASLRADADVAAEIETTVLASVAADLAAFASNGNTLAADVTTRLASASNDAAEESSMALMSTQLAGEIDLDARFEAVIARVASLRGVINAEAELEAETRNDMRTTLDTAAEHITDARAELARNAEAAAEASIVAAEELAGEVEAALSLLGTITIDQETGLIIDVDLANPPATHIDLDATTNSGLNIGE